MGCLLGRRDRYPIPHPRAFTGEQMETMKVGATMDQIAEFLRDDSPWIDSEKWVIRWQFGLLGDFQTALAHAIALADDMDLVYLGWAFPVQVQGFRDWQSGNLGRRLREAGLDI